MADATTTIKGRMRSQRERRAPAKFRDYEVSLKGSKRETEEIRLMYCRRFLKEKPVDFYTKISSCISDGVSRDMIAEDHPNPYVCLKSKHTQRSIPGSHRQSKRITKATSIVSILPKRLTDALFDHCFQNMWSESPEERKEMCTYMTCFFFNMYRLEHSREKVLVWIKRLNIFSKKYVFVPILMWSHWYLLIFCHLGESLDSRTRTPCMLLLDSLHAYSSLPELEPLIRRFVLEIFETEGRPESKEMVEKIPLLVPEVPQQINFTGCGIFVLYYISLFLEGAPENFSIYDGYPYFMTENWFTRKQLKGFYGKLEALGFQSSEDEEVSTLSDSEE
ncbi:hypothetical protein C2S51_024533 [Perilla frutescens var. frutescens]|nr:hypothetical protein C2S51_024533 [Perilla frutescens var. frutescens]